ncbi:MAG: hypothetical protein U0X92_14175 [Anaerolineales bacterium]
MSDSTIIVISILVFFLILFGGTAWLVFVYFPKKTLSVANELAETVKRTLGLTPQVIINQKIIYKRTNEILQLAMIEQDYDVEYETSDKLLGSEKQIHLRGMSGQRSALTCKRIQHRSPSRRIPQAGSGHFATAPRRDSVRRAAGHPEDVFFGLINWVLNKDIENATKELNALALDKASKLEMLADAEKRIENRLTEALLPRLVNYQLTHQVKFLELGTGESN